MLGSLNAVGQRLPAGQHVCGHRIQKQHPVQTGVAVHIGKQAPADRHGRRWRLDQARWIGSARRWRPPKHPSKHKERQETEGNGISRTTSTQKPSGRCLESSPFQERETKGLPFRQPGLGHLTGQVADPTDGGGALGH